MSKNILIILLLIGISSSIGYNVYSNAPRLDVMLDSVWMSRSDLQNAFPDGINGIKDMEGWTLKEWAEEFGCLESKLLKEYNIEADKEYIYRKYIPIENALRRASNNTYSEEFNCVQFSKQLKEELSNVGIESNLISGRGPGGHGHMWLGIWFEPITGNIILINNDYKN